MMNIVNRISRISGLVALLMVFLCLPSKHAFGQLGDLGDLFEAGIDEGKEDARLLFQEYLKPFTNGFGAGINSGWVDRAKTHGLLGFHVKLNLSAAMVPDIHRSFDIEELGLARLQILKHGPETPTFSGQSSGAARLGYSLEGLELANFRMPPGTGIRYIVTPMVQGGVGLPKNTDIMVRFIPPFKFLDYGELYLYGLGLKHELNQWLPGGAFLPVTFSVMAGYTSFGTSAGLNARPVDFDANADLDPDGLGGPNASTWDNQEIIFSTSAYTVNLIVGKSLPIISVYGGAGFESSTTNVKVEGDFPYYTPELHEAEFKRKLNALNDPLDLSFDGANKLRALAGLRISLPLITFNAEYTLSDYSMVTFGLGVSLR